MMKKDKKQKQPSGGTPSAARKSYQDDPRYKSFYENIRRAQHRKADYDEEPRPMTLDELEESAWDANAPSGGLAAEPAPTPLQPAPTPEPPRAPEIGEVLPGTIMRLDDGSVAIYKDAVSGKDYALFYFLVGDGSLEPRGIFLEQYETQRIGMLPRAIFEEMCRSHTWDREAILYHLDQFEFRACIPPLVRPAPAPTAPAPQVEAPRVSTASEPAPVSRPPERPAARPRREEPKPPPARDPLERGRILRINVGGHIWEAVYWTNDEIGPIVAHDTNREWALMHLDLKRFGDSLEYGALLEQDKLAEIERSLARHGH